MPQATLSFDGLRRLRGGAFAAEIDREFRTLLQDMMQRPADGTARSITIKIDLKPKTDTDEFDRLYLDEVVITASASSKTPKLQARPVRAKLIGDDQPRLAWEEDAPDNPDQKSLLDAVESAS